MFNQTIGEKKAMETARFIVSEAELAGKKDNYINLELFADQGEKCLPVHILDLIQELKQVNNGNSNASIRIAYDFTLALRSYFYKFIPSTLQLAMMKHYGPKMEEFVMSEQVAFEDRIKNQ